MCTDDVPGILVSDVCCPNSCRSCGGKEIDVCKYIGVTEIFSGATGTQKISSHNMFIIEDVDSPLLGLGLQGLQSTSRLSFSERTRPKSTNVADQCSPDSCKPLVQKTACTPRNLTFSSNLIRCP